MSRPSHFLLHLLAWHASCLSACEAYYQGPGAAYQTPKGVTFYMDPELTQTSDTIAGWIDRRVDEWILHKMDWGCEAWTDSDLLAMILNEPIRIRPGYFISGQMMGFTEFGSQAHIEVTVDDPAMWAWSTYDPAYVHVQSQSDPLYGFGLRQLPHELTHVARGRWHPE